MTPLKAQIIPVAAQGVFMILYTGLRQVISTEVGC